MEIIKECDLQRYNTFGISAVCKTLYKISSEEDLKIILNKEDGPFYILGGGSNLLISRDQSNIFLKNEIKGIEIIHENKESVIIKVGGGENWHEFVLWAIDHDFGGIENLSLIPGTVGAAPIQNIGAYGVELEEVFESLVAIKLETGELKTFYKKDSKFGYRNSVFKHELKGKFFITSIVLKLTKKDHKINTTYGAIMSELNARNISSPSIREISNVVIDIRRRKLPDPEVIGNSGSFFKNPIISNDQYLRLREKYPTIPSYPISDDEVKIPAGWMIDQAGWKGKRIGDAGCYENQALVLVNHGSATGRELLEFAQLIIEDIKQKFGITLTPEVNVI